LDAYLAMAEVILEQNVDPGWVQFFLVPILECCPQNSTGVVFPRGKVREYHWFWATP
jgi:hypothetical protein